VTVTGQNAPLMTELLFLEDAYERELDAVVTAVDGDRVALDRTVFYATGEIGRASCRERV